MLGVAACDAVSAAFRHFQNSAAFHLFFFSYMPSLNEKRKKGPASVLTITITVVTEAIKSYKWSAKSVIKFNILFYFALSNSADSALKDVSPGATSISEDSWRGLVAGIMIFFRFSSMGLELLGSWIDLYWYWQLRLTGWNWPRAVVGDDWRAQPLKTWKIVNRL